MLVSFEILYVQYMFVSFEILYVQFPVVIFNISHQQCSFSAAPDSSTAGEQDITKSVAALSLEPSTDSGKGAPATPIDKEASKTPSEKEVLPHDAENKSSHENSAEEKGSPVDWNGAEEETKIKLSKWGELYLEGVRSEVSREKFDRIDFITFISSACSALFE